jgi:hypothetical protein
MQQVSQVTALPCRCRAAAPRLGFPQQSLHTLSIHSPLFALFKQSAATHMPASTHASKHTCQRKVHNVLYEGPHCIIQKDKAAKWQLSDLPGPVPRWQRLKHGHSMQQQHHVTSCHAARQHNSAQNLRAAPEQSLQLLPLPSYRTCMTT